VHQAGERAGPGGMIGGSKASAFLLLGVGGGISAPQQHDNECTGNGILSVRRPTHVPVYVQRLWCNAASAGVMGSGLAASRRPRTTRNFYDTVVSGLLAAQWGSRCHHCRKEPHLGRHMKDAGAPQQAHCGGGIAQCQEVHGRVHEFTSLTFHILHLFQLGAAAAAGVGVVE
jgi:hypothetical protein